MFCCDKLTFVATNTSFVATKYACRAKNILVAAPANDILRRQKPHAVYHGKRGGGVGCVWGVMYQ